MGIKVNDKQSIFALRAACVYPDTFTDKGQAALIVELDIL